MRIHAFSGTRFSGVADAGAFAGPPYDQIEATLRDRLHEIPYHFAHLIRPVSATQNPHRSAADLHDRWLAEGVIARDKSPALYPYEIELAEGGKRLGICALVGIEDDASGVIRPHEATVPKTVAERLSLLRETKIDLEPILMLAEDNGSLNRLLVEDLEDCLPVVEHRDDQGNHHRLYRLDSPPRIAFYKQSLASCVGLIADGHHRYTVARRYAESDRSVTDAAKTKMAVITSLDSPGLRIDPIHRQLQKPLSAEPAAALATSHRRLENRSGLQIAEEVARSPQPAIAVSSGKNQIKIWGFENSPAPPTLPSHLQHLAVGWLHDAILPALGLELESATDGTVRYRSDPDQLLAELQESVAAIGFWLPPMAGDDFSRAMSGGQLLPPKSTRFLPKVASGLVWASHDCALL